jgi:rhodanese-related sulfurtransferase
MEAPEVWYGEVLPYSTSRGASTGQRAISVTGVFRGARRGSRLAELPLDREIVAYCRGPFCLLSDEAVRLLGARGYRVRKISDGVSEWQAAGMPLEGAGSRGEKAA